MAQAYSELGATVTIVEALDRLVAGEEPFVADELSAAFRERGIDIRLGVTAEAVHRDGASVKVELSDGRSVEAPEILVATGRRPLTGDLGLETVGLEPGETIEVDDTLRVPKLPWLFAVGDVNGRSLLTHMAKYQARVAAQVIAGREARATRDDHGAPRAIFTDPQVAAVGLTLQCARDGGINARAYDVATSDTPGASFHGRNTPGTSRLVVDEDRSVIVGATFYGHGGRGLAASRDDRPRRRDPTGAAAGGRAGLPHTLRGLAASARALERQDAERVVTREVDLQAKGFRGGPMPL